MGMCGTVRCRPTLAYRVHFDGISISDWTDYKILLQREMDQCWFNVRPTSATLTHIKSTFGEYAVVAQVYRVYMIWELALNAAM